MFDRWEGARNIIDSSLRNCNELDVDDLGYHRALPALAQHNKDAVLLYLLPYLLKLRRTRQGKPAAEKISIREKQEAFFIHTESAADIDRALKRQRQICTAANVPLQPIPVFVGPLVNLEAYYVYVNDDIVEPTIYQAPTALHAVDLSFKIFFALNCAFAPRAHATWLFIQKALYDINLPTDNCSRDTHTLIARIALAATQRNENIDPNIE